MKEIFMTSFRDYVTYEQFQDNAEFGFELGGDLLTEGVRVRASNLVLPKAEILPQVEWKTHSPS